MAADTLLGRAGSGKFWRKGTHTPCTPCQPDRPVLKQENMGVFPEQLPSRGHLPATLSSEPLCSLLCSPLSSGSQGPAPPQWHPNGPATPPLKLSLPSCRARLRPSRVTWDQHPFPLGHLLLREQLGISPPPPCSVPFT